MGTGYTRNDTSNNIADGNIINAADLDGEFDAIESAFGTSGHTHDGTSAEGGPVTVLGPTQDFVASATEIKPKTTNTLDIGTNLLLFKDMYLDGVATLGSIKIDNGGAIGSASDADAIVISSGGVVTFSQAPLVDVTNATTNAVTDVLGIRVQSTGTPAVGIGSGLTLGVETASGNIETGGAIRIVSTGLTPTDEEIDLVFYSMRNGSLTEGFRYDSSADTFSITGSATISSTLGVTSTSTFSDDVTLTGASYNVVWDKSDNALEFADNAKAIFGAGSDLQIYHDGANSYIQDTGTGALGLFGSTFVGLYETGSGDKMVIANGGSDVELYYDNALKLATTSTGIDVTGTVTADGLTVDGDVLVKISSANYTEGLTLRNTANWGYGTSLSFEAITSSGGSNAEVGRITSTWNTAGYHGLDFYTLNNNTLLRHMRLDGYGDFSLYEDTGTTAKFFWDASAESLGIGTSSPLSSASIHIQGSDGASGAGVNIAANELFVDNNGNTGVTVGTSNTGTGYYAFADSDVALRGGLFYDHSTDDMGFRVSSSTRMTLDSSGNVGIGTTSPSAPLHVNGGSSTGFATVKHLELGFTASRGLTISTSQVVAVDDLVTFDAPTTTYGQMAFKTAGSERLRIDSSGNVALTGDEQELRFHSDYSVGNTDRAKIKAIGAGGGSGYGGDLVFYTKAPTNTYGERMRINSSGQVGIGTGSPISPLHINVGTNQNLRVFTASSTPTIGSLNDANSAYAALGYTASQHEFRIGTSDAMRIDSSGNVGIGAVPYSWSNLTALQLERASISGGQPDTYFTSNGYYSTTAPSGWKYGSATTATQLYMNASGGEFVFRNAASGAADAALTWSEAMRIDSSGNLLVGTTDTTPFNNNAGTSADFGFVVNKGGGYTSLASYNTTPLYINRTSSDGDIVNFRKDGSTVGSIGSFFGNLMIGKESGARIAFSSTGIYSSNNSGTTEDASYSLGTASSRFTDLYLSGFVSDGSNVGLTSRAIASGGVTAFKAQQARGSLASPTTALANGDGNYFASQVYNGTSYNTIAQIGMVTGSAVNNGDIVFATAKSGSTSTKMILDEDGNLLVGTTSDTGGRVNITRNGIVLRLNTANTSNTAVQFVYNGNTQVGGITTTTTSTAYNTSSDHRLKENVVELTDATTRLKQLEPKRFNFIADADTTVDGFLAHEVQTVVPEAITGTHNEVDADGNPVYQGIDQSKLVPLLVATIKELEARITALENA